MAISTGDVKTLWARSGDRCAFPACNVPMTQTRGVATSSYPLGEMAHIVADSESGPRGNSPLKSEQRDRYENLILLCPNHHTLIDRDEDAFLVELLHAYKSEHEAWVRDRMGLPDSTDDAALHLYGRLIDMVASELFTRWSDLTERAMYVSPYWLKADVERVRRFRQAVLRAPFSERNREHEQVGLRAALTPILVSLGLDRDGYRNTFDENRYRFMRGETIMKRISLSEFRQIGLRAIRLRSRKILKS